MKTWLITLGCILVVAEAGFFESEEDKINQEGLINTIVASKHVARALETVKPIDYSKFLEKALDLLVGNFTCLILILLLASYAVVRAVWLQRVQREIQKRAGQK